MSERDETAIYFPPKTVARFRRWAVIAIEDSLGISTPDEIEAFANHLRARVPDDVAHYDDATLRVLIALMLDWGEQLLELKMN